MKIHNEEKDEKEADMSMKTEVESPKETEVDSSKKTEVKSSEGMVVALSKNMEVSDEFDPTSDHELEVQCNECTEIFSSESNLKAHLELNHIEIKTLHCHLCPFATTQRFELQLHMQACL